MHAQVFTPLPSEATAKSDRANAAAGLPAPPAAAEAHSTTSIPAASRYLSLHADHHHQVMN